MGILMNVILLKNYNSTGFEHATMCVAIPTGV